jgi:uncharacterized protein (DUF302 family)
MSETNGDAPAGARDTVGVVHRRSPLSVPDTVDRLTAAIGDVGAKLFAVIDQSGEAEEVGLALRDTRLVLFGNPAVGTPLMAAEPVAALDLPLKILVWADDARAVWMTYLSAAWLAERHGLSPDQAKPLAAVEVLTGRIAAAG